MATPDAPWEGACAAVGRRLGLHFPHERIAELKRALRPAASELGLADADACAAALAAGQFDAAQMGIVAAHLTVGETYFMRGEETFDALRGEVLPALLEAAQSGGGRALKVWSAGCCTGEEAYSLAVLVEQLSRGDGCRDVDILATDLNPRFLAKAKAGIYGEWSFRGTSPAFRGCHFRATGDGRFALDADIRGMVRFARLNLVDAHAMSAQAEAGSFDLILCRNVLMYFHPDLAAQVVQGFHRALRPGGWLVVAPCEISQPIFSRFESVRFGDAIFHRKVERERARLPEPPPIRPPPSPFGDGPADGRLQRPRPPSTARPRPEPARPPPAAPATRADDPARHERMARALADQGQLEEALACCDAWVAASKLDAGAHYLRAVIQMEREHWQDARDSLQRCLYLEPEDAMARFALAKVEGRLGRHAAARQQYRNLLDLLASTSAPFAQVRGISAGQLERMVRGLLQEEQPT